MNEQPAVIVKTETSPVTKGFYFLLGVIASCVTIWAYHPACGYASDAVQWVVDTTPVLIEKTTTTVEGWVSAVE